MTRAGFFTYPWDMADNPEQVVAEMAGEHHCNAIMLNANYHHARLLNPRSASQKTYQTTGAIAAFSPNPAMYGDSGLLPVVDPALASTKVLDKTKRACEAHQMDFGVWLVGLHNSSLGAQHPDLCVTNCFGDVYQYALCPSRDENKAYFAGMVTDICDQFEPDRIAAEAIGVLGLLHWVHHELFLNQWDENLEMLLSICFCPSCVQKGQAAGVDVEALRQDVCEKANWLLNEERGALALDFRHGEPAGLMMEMADLWQYLQVCAQSVTELVKDLHDAVAPYKTQLDVFPSSFHRPVSRAWLERVALGEVSKHCDGLFVSSYFISPAEVAADLKWAAKVAPHAPLVAGLNACAPIPDAGTLTAQALACRSVGCEGVYYYNYGLLNDKRLGWISGINLALLDQ